MFFVTWVIVVGNILFCFHADAIPLESTDNIHSPSLYNRTKRGTVKRKFFSCNNSTAAQAVLVQEEFVPQPPHS